MFLRCFFIAALLILAGCDCSVRAKIPFDSAKWKGDIVVDQPGKDMKRAIGDIRHGMLKDLSKNNHLKTLMTKDDVEKLLGTPNRVYFRAEVHRPTPGIEEFWYYDIWCSCDFCAQFVVGFDDKGFYRHHQITDLPFEIDIYGRIPAVLKQDWTFFSSLIFIAAA